ncbi:MAG TPA: TrkA family potassium uptake protein [Coriobacteriia bacterium]|nr:TrkA family potassium uptake protein [Coriobacteriia bacterium]
MNAVIVGGGKVGSHLAKILAGRGAKVVVIEENMARCDLIKDEMAAAGVQLIHGDGDEPAVLDAAGIRSAEVVVAATGHDEDNLVVSLLGKREYNVPTTLARVNNPRNAWLFTERFGVDETVSSTAAMVDVLEGCCGGKLSD